MGFTIPVKLRSEEEGVSQKADPKSIVSAIRAFVGAALMRFKLPGAFTVPVSQVWEETDTDGNGVKHTLTGKVDFKALPSAQDGHFMYHMSGDLILNGIPLKVNGNLPLPKDNKYYLASDATKLYSIAKKATQKGVASLTVPETQLLDKALEMASQTDEEAELSAQETTGDEEASEKIEV